jgi:hypothetical protein
MIHLQKIQGWHGSNTLNWAKIAEVVIGNVQFPKIREVASWKYGCELIIADVPTHSKSNIFSILMCCILLSL